MTSGWERYLAVVRSIPRGHVATYGTIAALAGSPRGARQVGYALAAAHDPALPWHRVVGRRGRSGIGVSLTGGGREKQVARLADEGIVIGPDGAIEGAAEWFGDEAAPLP